MSRQVKSRRVEALPKVSRFIPSSAEAPADPVVIKVEEVEAMRLKDIEGLNQRDCAVRMEISRQTFQNILDAARRKCAAALTEGRAIEIRGGDYKMRMCRFACLDCGAEYGISFSRDRDFCPKCGSPRVLCKKKADICRDWCSSR